MGIEDVSSVEILKLNTTIAVLGWQGIHHT